MSCTITLSAHWTCCRPVTHAQTWAWLIFSYGAVCWLCSLSPPPLECCFDHCSCYWIAWNNMAEKINYPPNFVSPVRYCLLHVHLLSHMVVHLYSHHFHHVSPVLSFTLNLRLGYLANPFHHRSLPYLLDWFYRLSAHLTFIFCSTAGSVCTVC